MAHSQQPRLGVVRNKVDLLPWQEWFSHRLLLEHMSICLWKLWFNCLAVDERVKNKGVSLASACDCYIRKCLESLDHILSSGEVATEVWARSAALGVPCM